MELDFDPPRYGARVTTGARFVLEVHGGLSLHCPFLVLSSLQADFPMSTS